MIDRYFDAMDLNNTDIYIEWETPKGKNSTPIKSVSETYLKIIDDEKYPGKLIFGWAISDAITKESGTLKFAVRFIQWNDEKKIVYSFNTLTAQVTIHPNLGLDMENSSYNIDNCNDRLLERIEPSVVVGGAQAAIPYFLKNIVVLDEGYDIGPNHSEGTFDLSVVATANDTGAVSYVWKRSEIGADTWIEIPDSTKVSFVELTEKEYDDFKWKLPENRIYYIEREDDTAYLLPKGYYDLTEASTKDYFLKTLGIDLNGGEIPSLFEKRSVLTVEKYGQYKVEARNRIFNSLTKSSSEVATFKTPDPIVMDNKDQMTDKHIIGTDSAILAPQIVEAVGDLSYQWYRADEDAEKIYKYRVVDVPTGTKISYGNNHIRMMVPADTDFKKQTVGIGGNPNKFYVTLVNYIPDGAVYMRNGFKGVLSDEYEVIAEKSVGTDEYGYFRKVWFDIASFNPETNVWTYNGKNSTISNYAGRVYVAEYYDVNKKVIRSDALRIDLSNESCHVELKNYEAIEDIVDGVDLAKQNSYIVTEPGMYKMEVTRTRNRATTEGESIEYRVTNAPAVPVFDEDTFIARDNVRLDDLKSGERVLTIGLNPNIESDEYFVTWKIYREKKDDIEITTQRLKGVYITSLNPVDPVYAEVFEKAGEDVEAVYYATVVNKLNGVTSAPTEMPNVDYMFYVLDY